MDCCRESTRWVPRLPTEFTVSSHNNLLLQRFSRVSIVGLLTLRHYSRTCGEPEEVIDRKERKNLARVYVRLKSGSDLFQAGNGQALRHAKIVLVGMTAHTAGGRPKVRLLALFVASMGRKAPDRPNEPERGEGRQPVKPRARIRLEMHLAFL